MVAESHLARGAERVRLRRRYALAIDEGAVGAVEIVDQPALGKLLYECADGRGARPKPHKAEVTVAKRSEDAREKWQGCAH